MNPDHNATRTARTDLLRVLDEYHSAMVSARTDTLDELLTPDFTLVHITGYVQPKAEWFSVIRSGDFDYHAIHLDESSLAVEVNAGTAVDTAFLKGRGVFNATISGMKNPWRLQFTIQFAKHQSHWRLVQARYTGY
jgi:hypothetical protein